MTLPRFLIIGAMKAGTTTLYEDLLPVEGLWLPPQKEPEDLIDPEIESPDRLAVYSAKYAGCPDGAMPGDASTAYAKRPTHEDVAPRARRVLGEDIRIIYMTRDPVRRIVSQYHHLWGLQLEQRPLNEAVLEDPQYIGYSRYDWQLEPWRDTFGDERILVVRFEDYLADRAGELARICAFLGVEPPADAPDETHRNRSDGKHFVPRGGWVQKVAHSKFYTFKVKPLISTNIRDIAKKLFLPKARKMSESLTLDTQKKITAELQEDAIARDYSRDK